MTDSVDCSYLKVYTDGASRGNPGEAGIGLAFFDPGGNEVCADYRYIGITTNNVAEYTALIAALEKGIKLEVRRLDVYSDSELMVRQMNGQYRVKDENLQRLFSRAKELVSHYDNVRLTHIPREKNKRADSLANRAIDEKSSGVGEG